jgi:hypothetical protein
MVNESGATWSFKKNGRIDAAFVRLTGTNAVLLAPDATYRTLPLMSLSQTDRSYLYLAGGVSERETGNMVQIVPSQTAAFRHVFEATRLKNQASARRRLAQFALDAAAGLENEAGELSGQRGHVATVSSHQDAVTYTPQISTGLSRGAAQASVTDGAEAAVKKADADSPNQDSVRLRNQAAERRASAARLQREADGLEQAAHLMDVDEMGPGSVSP